MKTLVITTLFLFFCANISALPVKGILPQKYNGFGMPNTTFKKVPAKELSKTKTAIAVPSKIE